MKISQNFTTGPKVFIIVLHYQNWDDTNECLASLDRLDYDNFEKVVIDNDKDNRGFAGGNNIGIKQAMGKGVDPRSSDGASYILLLNNDTVVEPDFLKKLVEAGEREERVGILGPVIYEYGTKKIHFTGGKVNWLYTKGIHITKSKVKSPSPRLVRLGRKNPKVVDYITGACLLIKRKVIEKIGLMPEEYFLYCEDVDWCLKARKNGFSCLVVPGSQISHKVSSSSKIASFSYIYYHTRNGLLLAKRNAPFLIKILTYLNSFWVYLKQVLKLVIMPSKSVWAKAIMKGIGDFYKGKFGKLQE